MKYYIWSLGCQMNTSDAERIAATLEAINYLPAKKEAEADLIVVVSCSVRQSAIDRIHGKIRDWNLRKVKEPLVTVLTGCVLAEDRAAFEKKFDLVFDVQNLPQLPAMLAGKTAEAQEQIKEFFNIAPQYASTFQAFVPIMTGCNNFCSYCAVPYARGREYSRPHAEIVAEIKSLLESGYKEITLLGQNVNSYGNDDPEEISFPELVQMVNDLEGDFWLRYITSHPKDMSDELIKKFTQAPKLAEYLHLPIQAGNDSVLKKMNRHYTVAHYRALIEKIRAEKPDVALSTDVIVGFPGETVEQFEDTARAMAEIKYDMAYIAQYSPRSGTVAAKMDDDVPQEEKKRRDKALNVILAETALEHNRKYLGQEVTVLTDKYQKGVLFGRTRSFKLVAIKTDKRIIGEFVHARISAANSWALEGELIGPNPNPAAKSER